VIGIQATAAAAIVAEIGVEMDRFPSDKRLARLRGHQPWQQTEWRQASEWGNHLGQPLSPSDTGGSGLSPPHKSSLSRKYSFFSTYFSISTNGASVHLRVLLPGKSLFITCIAEWGWALFCLPGCRTVLHLTGTRWTAGRITMKREWRQRTKSPRHLNRFALPESVPLLDIRRSLLIRTPGLEL